MNWLSIKHHNLYKGPVYNGTPGWLRQLSDQLSDLGSDHHLRILGSIGLCTQQGDCLSLCPSPICACLCVHSLSIK